MCIKSTLYRVTYKGRDSRDDCTDFFCVCFLIFTIPCNCKFFFMNPIFLFSPPPYICLHPDNTCFILFFSLGGSVYYRARSSENMRGGGYNVVQGVPRIMTVARQLVGRL